MSPENTDDLGTGITPENTSDLGTNITPNNSNSLGTNITPEQLSLVIMVAERLAPKFIFGFYDLDDIKQEAITLGLDALNRWDKKRPLENFLHIHIRNRLNTLRRDKYYRADVTYKVNKERDESIKDPDRPHKLSPQETKRGLLNCVDIDTCPQPTHEIDLYPFEKEMIEKLENDLPAKFRGDYLKAIGGGKLSPKRKGDLIYQIKLLLGRYT